jgi:hypothetical protein
MAKRMLTRTFSSYGGFYDSENRVTTLRLLPIPAAHRITNAFSRDHEFFVTYGKGHVTDLSFACVYEAVKLHKEYEAKAVSMTDEEKEACVALKSLKFGTSGFHDGITITDYSVVTPNDEWSCQVTQDMLWHYFDDKSLLKKDAHFTSRLLDDFLLQIRAYRYKKNCMALALYLPMDTPQAKTQIRLLDRPDLLRDRGERYFLMSSRKRIAMNPRLRDQDKYDLIQRYTQFRKFDLTPSLSEAFFVDALIASDANPNPNTALRYSLPGDQDGIVQIEEDCLAKRLASMIHSPVNDVGRIVTFFTCHEFGYVNNIVNQILMIAPNQWYEGQTEEHEREETEDYDDD